MNCFENTNCCICGPGSYKVLYSSQKGKGRITRPHAYLCTDVNNGDFGRIVKCDTCGLIYAAPRLKPEVTKKLYSDSVDIKYIQEKPQRILSFRKAAKECEKFKSGGNLLDIGCLCGFFLEAVPKDKWERFGVELSKWGCDYIAKHSDLRVFNGDLLEANYPDKYFDLITMWDTLEHLNNPREVLIEIHRIIKDDGILCFVVPNINSLMASVFRSRWWFFIQSHLYYFTPRTIKKLLQKTGFRIIKRGTYGRSFTLSYWATKIEPYSKTAYKILNNFINTFGIGKMPLSLDLGDHMIVYAKKQ